VTRAYLSLGSNVDPEMNLCSALAELRATFGAIVVSPAYRTASVGFDGPDFFNLAVGLDTDLDAPTLDAWLHALEDRHGRRRDVPRYSSRTLDIDIVLFGDERIEGPGHLRIPRPELREAFVLRPLADIAPDAIDPDSGARIGELWKRVEPKPAMETVALDVSKPQR
jgi:2-amino-4-hydroxy-6-hydroxymethyldihydropteridine diphosphokinase